MSEQRWHSSSSICWAACTAERYSGSESGGGSKSEASSVAARPKGSAWSECTELKSHGTCSPNQPSSRGLSCRGSGSTARSVVILSRYETPCQQKGSSRAGRSCSSAEPRRIAARHSAIPVQMATDSERRARSSEARRRRTPLSATSSRNQRCVAASRASGPSGRGRSMRS